MATVWHNLSVSEAVTQLETDPDAGLSSAVAEERLTTYGSNSLEERDKKSVAAMLLDQFNDFMIWVLIAAAVVSGVLLREIVDSLAIVAILILNATLGLVQEFKAEESLQALRKLTAPTAQVIRDSLEQEVAATSLVPGDILLLKGGDIIPADARLLEASALSVDESALTGESIASTKDANKVYPPGTALGDLKNMLFTGTVVNAGRARAVVVQTGPSSEMGKIAEMVQTEEEKTPLQAELKRVGKIIAVTVLVIAGIVFATGLIQGRDAVLMFLAAVTLAVAAIPEGLPAIVSVTLAVGVQAMAAKNAIVRRLHAVETLGATNVICTDKTGTLTVNRMTAELVTIGTKTYRVGDGGLVGEDGGRPSAEATERLAEVAALANDAHFAADGRLIGEPTEVALLLAADKLGASPEQLQRSLPRVAEIPFDSTRKRMTTIHQTDQGYVVMTKGAPEVLLRLSSHFMADGELADLTPNAAAELLRKNEDLAERGYRTLGFAYRRLSKPPGEPIDLEKDSKVETDLTFLGFVGLVDPPRPEVFEAIETAKRAGIKVSMVTGDHRLTAYNIARQIGLLDTGEVMTGQELEEIREEELSEHAPHISVYARVDPAHKVKIVSALKSRGYVVAMTGDGVNDAPAIKRADIGIAMGEVGTDVAKEAADMILADDNFATIVKAVREGRLIFENLKKFILFLLSCNTSEVLVMFAAMVAGLPLPLLPIQILWINLVTDGLPALALGMDPPAPDLMDRPPRSSEESILAPRYRGRTVVQGLLMMVGVIAAFVVVLLLEGVPLSTANEVRFTAGVTVAQTATFFALVVVQLLHSLNFRSETVTVFSRSTFANRRLLLAIAGSLALQIAVVYLPFAQRIFKTTGLGLTEWVVVLGAVIVPLLLIDLLKVRMARPKPATAAVI